MTTWNRLKRGSSEYDSNLVNQIKRAIPKAFIYPQESLMHNKFIVLLRDEIPYAVITGSYNYTTKANTNRENIVYIEDSEVASSYSREFRSILKESKAI
jgi:phosphatidylserine/phosphatidylglycerophosphate/cardiolipin synthase-like enzyme